MPDIAAAMQELVAAYRCLVKISHDKLTAEQVGQLRELEQKLALALIHLPRNKMERKATKEFIERMYERSEPL